VLAVKKAFKPNLRQNSKTFCWTFLLEFLMLREKTMNTNESAKQVNDRRRNEFISGPKFGLEKLVAKVAAAVATRVTRLGEFSPIGSLFPLGRFF
jgi:hypothetical protein